MHRLAATPGGWTPQTEGVILVEQDPADLVILTAADSDIQTLARAIGQLPSPFATLRAVNLLQLQQQLSIDTYAEQVLSQARGIVLRLLGGRAYWPYGLEVVKEVAAQTKAHLWVIPGDDRPDPDLISHSTVPLSQVNQLWRYWCEGGVENVARSLSYLADCCLGTQYQPEPAQPVAKVGLSPAVTSSLQSTDPSIESGVINGRVAIIFYRAHYLAGNTAPITALCKALRDRQLEPIPLYVSSLSDPEVQAELQQLWLAEGQASINLILNTTGFAIQAQTQQDFNASPPSSTSSHSFWQQLNVPVLQAILSSGTEAQWLADFQGLGPRDIAMNVALPEVDGRLITRPISFKGSEGYHPALQTDVIGYVPQRDRLDFVAELASNWVHLSQTPVQKRQVALILANYPNRDGRLANGVGLDTPQSCVEILRALQNAGYDVGDPALLPTDSQALMQQLLQGTTNDPESQARPQFQSLSVEEYQQWFSQLPDSVQNQICDRWGPPVPQQLGNTDNGAGPSAEITDFAIAGWQLGQIFIGIQPSRGYDQDPSLNYHAPDLEPTHAYLAFYVWLRQRLHAQAIVHVGKHGNLEWLPGKSIALSATCYPEIALGALPHFYPFIVNDPGEGSQAKRRAQAVILDHLTPPLTRAELYGPLLKLEQLIDEYYDAQTLDPKRVPVIERKIATLVQEEQLLTVLTPRQDADPKPVTKSKSASKSATLSPTLLGAIDTYLCELKEAQIRDGLHILGQCPTGEQLRDLLIAIARSPSPQRLGLTRAIAKDWGLDFDPLTTDLGQALTPIPPLHPQTRTVGDAVAQLETTAQDLVEPLLAVKAVPDLAGPRTQQELQWLRTTLLPQLQQTPQEIDNLLRGLAGQYIPPGPSGAPTRGRMDVLPTGRNFYSVDLRGLPTESAWDVGRKAAAALIERYTQDHGEYPTSIGLSVWGTSTMRTGGDDLAEALALMGVRPVWDGTARRVVDLDVLPLESLGRPRVDVTLRISGFFRDAFPNLISWFDQAVQLVASLPEAAEQNPIASRVQTETETWQQLGLTAEQAKTRSHYRIFGSKPGAYGAGLQGLIEAQNWQTDADLAQAYLNWSSYAYTGQGKGQAAPESFQQRLAHLDVVLHNQDNREHDLLDSDDYYQFQGGLTAAVRHIQGQQPKLYFGDHARPEQPRIRLLSEEIDRVYRSRVINPKWIQGVMRHGYKGAFEIAATVDYLFAYDATTHCVADYMYEGVTQAYALDPAVQQFMTAHNPWALRDLAERLLEAHQRQLWQDAPADLLAQLRLLVLETEGAIESVT
ncbi:MAG: cobaltochelatase subunit CobN [Cyanobacteria bacterium P01_H01_bin.121]